MKRPLSRLQRLLSSALGRRRRDLRASELRYRTLIQEMNEGLLQVDSNDVIEFANERFCEMVGYRLDELVGRLALDLLLIDDQERSAMRERMTKRQQGIAEHYEIRMRTRSGGLIWVLVSGAPLLDADGNVVGSIGVHTDITARKQSEAALAESEGRYRLMAEHATDMISRMTPTGVFLYVSPASRALLGYEPEELIGRPPDDLVHADDHPRLVDLRRTILKDPAPFSVTSRMLHRDGRTIWVETTLRTVRTADDPTRVEEVIGVSRDVTDRTLAEQRVQYDAYHDSLTDLPNRRLFEDRVRVALAHADRDKSRDLPSLAAVLFVDIDRFKVINDTFGHYAGDEALKAVARRLTTTLRAEDTIARFGGDEFLVLLWPLRNPEVVVPIAEKLLRAISEPLQVVDREVYVTASIGIATYPDDGTDCETLISNADRAMYRAKQLGRNTYRLYTPQLRERARERLELETELHRARARNELRLFYQPLVDTVSRRMTGVEALIRWQHPTRGLLTAFDFIAAAEQSGVIRSIGEWSLNEAFAQIVHWRAAGVVVPRVAMNLSAAEFQQRDLLERLDRLLSESLTDPEHVELEITERTAMIDIGKTIETLEALEQRGVAISIDDFGTGHSSLAYLRDLPITTVKIDRSFIIDIARDSASRAIVSSIAQLGRGLKLRVVAEGIEEEEQLTIVTELGCDEAQGYLFGRAVAAEDLVTG